MEKDVLGQILARRTSSLSSVTERWNLTLRIPALDVASEADLCSFYLIRAKSCFFNVNFYSLLKKWQQTVLEVLESQQQLLEPSCIYENVKGCPQKTGEQPQDIKSHS